MAYDHAAKAKTAFNGGRFKFAADLYSEAIAAGRKYPELFRNHAKENIKRKNFTEAVSNANKAIDLDPSNLKAYLHKGMACFSLHEYQTAKTAFEAGSILAPEDARFTDWVKKCDKFIAEENVELPTQSSELCSTTKEVKQVKNGSNEVISTPAKPKYRHDFSQNSEEVIVAIYAKGIPAKNVFVKYGKQILSVTINVPGEDEYILQPRLFGKIVPAKCRFEVLLTRVEIRLAKAESIHWTSIELGQNFLVDQQSNVSAGHKSLFLSHLGCSRPASDWDMGVGDAASNKIFRDLYEVSDEDTRRILVKSFIWMIVEGIFLICLPCLRLDDNHFYLTTNASGGS
ncbi:hypothetical protein SSX86_013069 [Deinandra increscens subsp. villosa]|uniref:CS domain-containing protein n=1 Tax=Deinandra increscens subsp. villosa TaxID=3103831 RepID=A0AAP0GZE3_9ASTR